MIFNSPKESMRNALNHVAKIPFAKSILHKLNEAARGKCVVFFSLHRVIAKLPDFASHPHYLNKTALTPDQFHQLIYQIKKTLQFVSLNESMEILTGKQPINKSKAVLIIEVAYEQTLLLIKPILEELDIPVNIMLSTEQLNKRVMPWTDEIIYKFNKTTLKEIACDFFDRPLLLNSPTECLESAAHAISHLYHCDYTTFNLRLSHLRKILTDVTWPAIGEKMLSIAKLKTLAKNPLISFGCAGKSRIPFFKMALDEGIPEIVESSHTLRSHFSDKLCPIFFYKSGLYRRKDKMITNLMMEAGMLAAISDKSGVCRPGDNMFRLRRLPLAAGRNGFEKFELQGLANAIDEFLLVSLAQEKKY